MGEVKTNRGREVGEKGEGTGGNGGGNWECGTPLSTPSKIRNRYNQVPHLTQDTNGKVTNSQKTPQTRAKNQNVMFGLAQTSHFGLWDIIIIPPPPESQLAFHIYYVKHENTLTYKRISWDSGGNDVFENIFSISYMYNTKSDHFSPKIKPYIHGNRTSNAKS